MATPRWCAAIWTANEFAVFYLKDGKVVAADAVNSPKEFMICKQLIGKAVDPTTFSRIRRRI